MNHGGSSGCNRPKNNYYVNSIVGTAKVGMAMAIPLSMFLPAF